jgi:hypothetical protein
VGGEELQRVLKLSPRSIESAVQASARCIAFRIRGLEFARLFWGKDRHLTCGVGTQIPVQSEADWAVLRKLVNQILQLRQAETKDHRHPFYRLQSERWLESLILRDIRVIDADLDPHFVYPQVPMFLGADRGIVDILAMTRNHRLAVLELKVIENIELPMQGLDYWLRVRWHRQREEFLRRGYFPGLSMSTEAPLLYFVCPQFCYHSTFPALIHCIVPSVPMIQVGINENWRAGIRIVLRRTLSTATFIKKRGLA